MKRAGLYGAWLLGFGVIVAPEVPGQERLRRDDRRVVAGLLPVDFALRPEENRLKVRYPKQTPFELPLALEYPADHEVARSATRRLDIDDLWIVGRDVHERGVLAWIRVGGPKAEQWTLRDLHTREESDFIGVTFAPRAERLYVLDLRSRTILRAPFSPSAPALPKEWVPLAHASQFGDPEDLEGRGLALAEDGEEPQLSVYYVPSGLRDAPQVIDGREGPRFYVWPGEGHGVGIATRELRLDADRVALHGPPSAEVEFLRLDGPKGIEVLGRATLDARGGVELSVRSTPLVFGAIYGARRSPDSRPSSPFVTPEKRWGAPQRLADGTAFASERPTALAAFVGSTFFRVTCGLTRERSSSGPPRGYELLLLLGDATSAIRDQDGVPLLETRYAIGTRLEFEAGKERAHAQVPLPIPRDPRLGGAELRYQWLVRDGERLRASDIAGILVRERMWSPPGSEQALPWLLAARGADPGLDADPTTESATGDTAAEAWSSWLESCGARPLSEAEARDLHRRIGR